MNGLQEHFYKSFSSRVCNRCYTTSPEEYSFCPTCGSELPQNMFEKLTKQEDTDESER